MKNVNRLFVIIGIIIVIIIGRFFLAQNEVIEIPTVTVVTNDQIIDSVRGSYCWHSAGDATCVDSAAPHEMVQGSDMSYIKVQPNEEIEFKYDQRMTSISIQQWLEGHNYEEIATTARFNAPSEKGLYIIAGLARFNNGDVSDTIVIEVE